MIAKRRHTPVVLVVIALAATSIACGSASVDNLQDLMSSTDTSGTIEAASQAEEPAAQDIVVPAISNVQPTRIPQDLLDGMTIEEQVYINLYQRANTAVVNIDVSAEVESIGLTDVGTGSGFVIDPEGYIVTNNHVVEDADEVRVVFHDGNVLVGDVIGIDVYSDIAIVKVNPPASYELNALPLGDSDALLVGQRVATIGNPFGLSGSMAVGIVSALGRTLPTSLSTGGFSNPLIIQTDAAINPGNSGGPLLNLQGEVVGVNSAISTTTGENSGVGFAVPSNTVRRVAEQIIATGSVAYPYLGVSSNSEVSLAELAVEYDLPTTNGVLIAEVLEGGSAARAGLRGGSEIVTFRGQQLAIGGDIITAIDGFPVNNFAELVGYLVSNTSVDQTVTITVIREGETMAFEVTLDSRPE